MRINRPGVGGGAFGPGPAGGAGYAPNGPQTAQYQPPAGAPAPPPYPGKQGQPGGFAPPPGPPPQAHVNNVRAGG